MATTSVIDFLQSQRRGRPQTYKEIVACVDKSPPQCWRELKQLVSDGTVNVLVLLFNKRECAFYTVRDEVELQLLKGTTTEMIEVIEASGLPG